MAFAVLGAMVGILLVVLLRAVSAGQVLDRRDQLGVVGLVGVVVIVVSVVVVRGRTARDTASDVDGDSSSVPQQLLDDSDRRERRRRIEGLFENPSEPAIVYQPIIETATGRIVGAEALSRFSSEPTRTPDLWFAEANEVGLGPELELRAIRRAIAGLDEITDGYLSLNISARTLATPAFMELIARCRLFADRLVFEITEHDSIERYDVLIGAIDTIRSFGVRIAVDDAGAGYSSFAHILELRPDLIKLDRSVVSGLHADPVRRALVAAMADFAMDIGASVVAEGVEDIEELQALLAAGVTSAQGYLCGRPAALPLSAASGLLQPPLKALVVDDDPVVRMIISKVVRRAGLIVVGQADTGNQAIDLVSLTKPDVIVLDLEMPVLSGIDALPVLRNDHPEIHIVVLSAHEHPDTRQRVFDLGADFFVVKDDATTTLPQVLGKMQRIAPPDTTGSRAHRSVADHGGELGRR